MKNTITWLNDYKYAILDNLNPESIAVYQFIQQRAQDKNNDLTQDLLFQFVYRSFYRLDNAGLTNDFKVRYFKLMQDRREDFKFDVEEILLDLQKFKTRKGNESIQFSFTTKMFSTLNPVYPVYDREVAKMFDYHSTPQGDATAKIKAYLLRYEVILKGYEQIVRENLLKDLLSAFDKKYPGHQLSDTKRLDFIFWSAGKIKTQLLKKAENQQTSMAEI